MTVEKKNGYNISVEKKFVCKAKSKKKAIKKAIVFFKQYSDDFSIVNVKNLSYFSIPKEQVIIKL